MKSPFITIVIGFICLSVSACNGNNQYLKSIETEPMVTEYYNTTQKTITVISSDDQVLRNITFPPRYYNPFCVQTVTVNGEAIDIMSECRETTGTIESSAINYSLKKGDVIKLTVLFRPKPAGTNIYKLPNDAPYYAHTLMMLLEGKKVAQLLFNLRGMPIGTCQECRPSINGDKYVFDIEKLTIQSSGAKLTEQEKQAQEVMVSEPISFYIDLFEEGKCYLLGEDIPKFIIPTYLNGNPINVPVEGVDGEVAEGICNDTGEMKFEDEKGIKVKISTDLYSYTQLTTEPLHIPDDYFEDEMNAYKDVDPATITGDYQDTGIRFSNTSSFSLVGGIIPLGSGFYNLDHGVVGFKFELKLNRVEEQ